MCPVSRKLRFKQNWGFAKPSYAQNNIFIRKFHFSRSIKKGIPDPSGRSLSNPIQKHGATVLYGKNVLPVLLKNDEFLEHYHKRSNAESTVQMVKSKFGDFVRSKTWTAQVNEVLCKIICHDICVVIQEMHELGIEPDFHAENN